MSQDELNSWRKRIQVINFSVMFIILVIIPIIGTLSVGSYSYVFFGVIFQSTTVIVALIVFAIALFRISRTVKGIDGAFPNRGYTYSHFALVAIDLFFNLFCLAFNWFIWMHK